MSPSLLPHDTKLALTVATIDRLIYDLIRTEFSNRLTLAKLPINEQIQAYQRHGQHNIDFTKIYDLE